MKTLMPSTALDTVAPINPMEESVNSMEEEVQYMQDNINNTLEHTIQHVGVDETFTQVDISTFHEDQL
jgi:hypothetical protein